ncbi:putative uncharacterized protein DDB_G0291608 [Nylanderia fulva]|uniref:putative uncharacterized protein DDB_G0291608 n=1 Tax=Nylanderia fulva TaxID=613905 RepID=UPI0010FAD2C7|nr:putative uncharacterized protein DDB_G0291608 [Nylanderia fulva]
MSDYALDLARQAKYLDPPMSDLEIIRCVKRHFDGSVTREIKWSTTKSIADLIDILEEIQDERRAAADAKSVKEKSTEKTSTKSVYKKKQYIPSQNQESHWKNPEIKAIEWYGQNSETKMKPKPKVQSDSGCNSRMTLGPRRGAKASKIPNVPGVKEQKEAQKFESQKIDFSENSSSESDTTSSQSIDKPPKETSHEKQHSRKNKIPNAENLFNLRDNHQEIFRLIDKLEKLVISSQTSSSDSLDTSASTSSDDTIINPEEIIRTDIPLKSPTVIQFVKTQPQNESGIDNTYQNVDTTRGRAKIQEPEKINQLKKSIRIEEEERYSPQVKSMTARRPEKEKVISQHPIMSGNILPQENPKQPREPKKRKKISNQANKGYSPPEDPRPSKGDYQPEKKRESEGVTKEKLDNKNLIYSPSEKLNSSTNQPESEKEKQKINKLFALKRSTEFLTILDQQPVKINYRTSEITKINNVSKSLEETESARRENATRDPPPSDPPPSVSPPSNYATRDVNATRTNESVTQCAPYEQHVTLSDYAMEKQLRELELRERELSEQLHQALQQRKIARKKRQIRRLEKLIQRTKEKPLSESDSEKDDYIRQWEQPIDEESDHGYTYVEKFSL